MQAGSGVAGWGRGAVTAARALGVARWMRAAAGVLVARRAHPGRQEWRRGGGEHAHMLEVAHLLEGGHLVRVRVRLGLGLGLGIRLGLGLGLASPNPNPNQEVTAG